MHTNYLVEQLKEVHRFYVWSGSVDDTYPTPCDGVCASQLSKRESSVMLATMIN